MHDCPNCGQACCCSGDIDDCPVYTEEWVFQNCRHDCYEDELEDDVPWTPYEDPNWHPDEVLEYYASIGEPNPQLQINMETMLGEDAPEM